MATTDTSLVASIMSALCDSTEYAVLHNEDLIARGEPTSDIDVVVKNHPVEVVARLQDTLAAEGIYLVMLWNYDIGAWTSFWSRSPRLGGVQLDLWRDPEGRGRYGVRTDMLLLHRERGTRYDRLDRLGELAYLVRKRYVKGWWDQLRELVEEARERDVVDQLDNFVARSKRGVAITALNSRSGPSWGLRLRRVAVAPQLRRIWERLRRRTGVWIVISDDAVNQPGAVQHLKDDLEGLSLLLSIRPDFESTNVPRILWRLRRPCLVVTFGQGAGLEDGHLAASDLETPGALLLVVNSVIARRMRSALHA